MQGLRRTESPAILLLEDGTVFNGKALGAIGTSAGEIAFNTGMYGYQEIFTDPSYHKQMLVMATAHIGNYGVHEEEGESGGVRIAGLIVRNFSTIASRPSGSGTLQDDLVKNGLVGISDVDTRALVRHIRENGAMNSIISSEEFDLNKLKAQLSEVPSTAYIPQCIKIPSFASANQSVCCAIKVLGSRADKRSANFISQSNKISLI